MNFRTSGFAPTHTVVSHIRSLHRLRPRGKGLVARRGGHRSRSRYYRGAAAVVASGTKGGAVLSSQSVRAAVAGIIEPPARLLLRLGVSPDAVTIIGTVGVVGMSVGLLARGYFLWALLVALIFAPSDMLDGTMARLSGRSGPWGAFLDSTLDRVGDAAIFGAIAYWYASQQQLATMTAALLALAGGFVVSYARARAEGLGLTASVGLAERTERLLLVAFGVLLTGLGVTWALPAVLWVLVVLVWITVVQRMLAVRSQTRQGTAL